MNFLRHTSAGMLLLLLAAQATATDAPATQPASSTLPVAMPFERYKTMIERSPFAVATETAPASVVDVAGFTKDLVLTGAVRLGNGEYITISSRDQSQHFGLNTGETYNGISVVSVAWSDAVGKTKVTLKCGNEFGVIGYDEAVMNNPAAPPPPMNAPLANNGQPILPPGVTLPNPNPPRPAGSVVSPNPSGGPSAAPTPRRRIIRSVPPAP